MKRYNPNEIEPKWQKNWADQGTYKVNLKDDSRQKYFGFAMLPYPSGSGLHTGHVRTYTLADVTVRAKRQQGFNAYNPIGWDAFGLPAENYAIKTGTSPKETTDKAIVRFKEQLSRIGMSYDWTKEINTSDPEYYRWTQWIFTKLFEHGLAYQKESLQWWCDIDKTVLANEQVIGGKCWRHDGPSDPLVTKKALKQWFFKITDYVDELLDSTDDLEWPESIKTMQKNWIGKSVGAEIYFKLDDSDEQIKVFTTRPDTLYGATFIVLAPEHELTLKLATSDNKRSVEEYIKQAQAKTDVERQETDREKTGVFTGSYAINPINGEKIPVWTADYALSGYGTGAIMAVPAHDERDFEFAKKYDLPIVEVVAPEFGEKREDEQFVDGSTVFVYSKSTNRFLGLKATGGTYLVAGGINEGETHEACALRELGEEAGIYKVAELYKLGSQGFAHYRHVAKKANRFASTQPFIAIVEDEKNGEAKQEIHENFTNQWMSGDELYAEIDKLDGGKHWLEMLRRAISFVRDYKAGKINNTGIFDGKLLNEGILINSGEFNNLATFEAREKVVEHLISQNKANWSTNYKIRDWLISRQRYWGAPIPIVHCEKDGAVAIPEDQLPVKLPVITDYKAEAGKSPLAKVTDWVTTTCPKCGGPATRETDTMDGYACSSWYFLRYLDPHNNEQAWDPKIINHWMPIDFYNGADHAVSHLLYARFWMHFFHKIGLVADPEPVKKLVYNAYVLASDGTKMSKSKGNVVDPLEVVESGYGADALRVYEMFLAPFDMEAPWDDKGVPGSYRFLRRVWDVTQEFLAAGDLTDDKNSELDKVTNKTVKKVTADIEVTKFNTAIAAMMEMVNFLYKFKAENAINTNQFKQTLQSLLRLLAPFAPHISEELWYQLGAKNTIHIDNWPIWDENAIKVDSITIVVQVNGKLRAKLQMPADANQKQIEEQAKIDESVAKYLAGTQPKRVIYVPGKLLNIVV
ncbi:MAG TPA: class I tRNA ligase family protein [Candidatus Saccharimonadales bacterium]|nr:class I tRNA ligase family protein [Candidatus Saccharimonadales bacterium]